MKKLIASVALGTLLVAGFLFTQDQPADVAIDVEPSVFSIGLTGSMF